MNGYSINVEQCQYHLRAKNEVSSIYECCGRKENSAPCQVNFQHLHSDINIDNLSGFISTKYGFEDDTSIYAIDTEMIHTKNGLEVCDVSIVDEDLNIALEKFLIIIHITLD